MRLPIVTYPNKTLKQISSNVELFDLALHQFLDDMYETMMESNGIGLAAIQVANPLRILILCMPDDEGNQSKESLLEIINPEIINPLGRCLYQEGCLSVPGFYEEIERYETLTLTYQDRFGNPCTLDADGLLAIAIQHEMDHLDGIVFYNRANRYHKELSSEMVASIQKDFSSTTATSQYHMRWFHTYPYDKYKQIPNDRGSNSNLNLLLLQQYYYSTSMKVLPYKNHPMFQRP